MFSFQDILMSEVARYPCLQYVIYCDGEFELHMLLMHLSKPTVHNAVRLIPCINSMFVSTQSARQYQDKFRQHYDNFSVANLGEPNRFCQNCYDTTWILALALNNTLTGMMVQLFKVQYTTC